MITHWHAESLAVSVSIAAIPKALHEEALLELASPKVGLEFHSEPTAVPLRIIHKRMNVNTEGAEECKSDSSRRELLTEYRQIADSNEYLDANCGSETDKNESSKFCQKRARQ